MKKLNKILNKLFNRTGRLTLAQKVAKGYTVITVHNKEHYNEMKADFKRDGCKWRNYNRSIKGTNPCYLLRLR